MKQFRYDEESETLGQRIAQRLQEFRNDAHLTVEDMVKASGISRSGIEKMESPHSNPTIRFIDSYVRACQRTLGEFFEPWLPKGSPAYDRYIHREIAMALKNRNSKPTVYTVVRMLRQARRSR